MAVTIRRVLSLTRLPLDRLPACADHDVARRVLALTIDINFLDADRHAFVKMMKCFSVFDPHTIVLVLDDAVLDGEVVGGDIEAIGVVSCSLAARLGVGLVTEGCGMKQVS